MKTFRAEIRETVHYHLQDGATAADALLSVAERLKAHPPANTARLDVVIIQEDDDDQREHG